MRAALSLATILGVVGVAGCAKTPDLAQEEASIRATDSAMVTALNAHDLEGWLAHFAPEARMMPPGSPPVVGIAAIRELITAFMSPQFRVAHHLEGVVVSRSADLAYVWYSYELTFTGPTGAPVTDTGKDVSVYTRGSDGSWKLAVDMWSENQAAEPS
jgi:uncharacterized protein (TIGR02246 family)